MKKITRSNRGVAFLLSMCVLFSNLSWPAVAIAENDASVLCEHHPEHTEDCGYAAGKLCAHEHDESCYSLVCVHEHIEEFYPEALPSETKPRGGGHLESKLVFEEAQEIEPLEAEEQEAAIQEVEADETEAEEIEADETEPWEDEPWEDELEFEEAWDEDFRVDDSLDTKLEFEEAEELHEHGEECYVLDCPHVHDEDCGYVEAKPCEFVCPICSPVAYALANGIMLLAAPEDNEHLIAAFDFQNGLTDISGNGVKATLVNGSIDNNLTTENGNTYLDLTDNTWNKDNYRANDCTYLSLPGGMLNGMSELTVEMHVKWSVNDLGGNWAFYAAPSSNQPSNGSYVGIAFGEHNLNGSNNTVNAQRQNGGYQDNYRSNTAAAWPSDDNWHIVKVVLEEDKTYLYIDGKLASENDGKFSLPECIGQSGAVWIGGSAWPYDKPNNNQPGQFFKGCIDNIRIWGKKMPSIEEAHIVTDSVVDPEDTTVNLFDYWLSSQYESDYRRIDANNQLLFSKINSNHLLLFAGYYGLRGGYGTYDMNTSSSVGSWNAWTGNGSVWINGQPTAPVYEPDDATSSYYKPRQGIVNRRLNNGYPQLNLSNENPKIVQDRSELKNSDLRKESLAYLFDPDTYEGAPDADHEQAGKASYPNVTGLFRMDDKGYYYFNSNINFAELNAGQGWGDKTDLSGTEKGNHVTLFDTPWRHGASEGGDVSPSDSNPGQFFPFNHWATLFSPNAGGVTQNHNSLDMQDQAGQPMDHYFGMTVTTKFQQPMNGEISPGNHMTFEFSGDDDVWIFIDGVLVGDIGGIHLPDAISIDFATGRITYSALNPPTDNTGKVMDGKITHMNEYTDANGNKQYMSIKRAFELAGALDVTSWDKTNPTFATGSIHTLKFFYMERGNDVSNCSISFNLEPIIKDSIRKVNEDGYPLENAEFALYEASIKDSQAFNNIVWHTADEFQKGAAVITGLKSNKEKKGEYPLTREDGEEIDFTKYPNGSYFILRETFTPKGYRKNNDIVLQYDSNINTFTVVNKYETGAYASFVAKWTQHESATYYASYAPENGTVTKNSEAQIDKTTLRDGLAIVVPVFKQRKGINDDGNYWRWLPMYGSNTLGWQTIADSYQTGETASQNTEAEFVRDLALAAFLQMVETDDPDSRDWYLTWNEKTNRLSGDLDNLPGEAMRYVHNNMNDSEKLDKADLNLVTLFINADELETLLGRKLTFKDDNQRYDALRSALQDRMSTKRVELERARDEYIKSHPNEAIPPAVTDEAVVKAILDQIITDADYGETEPFNLMYSDGFSRVYRTALYVPNERRELRVRKVDSNAGEGVTTYIDGAVFAIFENPEDAKNFPGNTEYKSQELAIEKLETAKNTAGSGLLSYGVTATVKLDTSVDGYQKGLLVFREDETLPAGDGYAHIEWPSNRNDSPESHRVVWLKEIYSPDGYARNKNLVRVEVGNLAIYANATGYNEDGEILPEEYDDGIRVYAALGKLTQTLVKYALNNNVDITLRDIEIVKQKGSYLSSDSNGALNHNSWADANDPNKKDTYDLHYGLWSESLTSQYGQHAYEQTLPLFREDNGYVRIMPRQNQTDFRSKSSYYDQLGTELYNQLLEEAIAKAVEEKGEALTSGETADIETWVRARVYGGTITDDNNKEVIKGIIPELKELHSYNAKKDFLTTNGQEFGTPIPLDGLFGLMNVVEVTNKVIPISLKISKRVVGGAPSGDTYRFKISLNATSESNKWNYPAGKVDGEYHAYIHPTNHQVPVLDQHGNPIPVLDPTTGKEQKDGEGNTIYQMRDCGPADHTHDMKVEDEGYDHVHLVVTGGEGKIMNVATKKVYVLELKDGETLAVVGLPQGAMFTVEEEIESISGTRYRVTASRTEDMRPFKDDEDEVDFSSDYDYKLVIDDGLRPKKGSKDKCTNPAIEDIVLENSEWANDGTYYDPLTISGYLQTAEYAWDMQHSLSDYEPGFPKGDTQKINDIVIPPAEVKFINAPIIGFPDTGSHTASIVYWLFGITFIIGLALIFIAERRRPADS